MQNLWKWEMEIFLSATHSKNSDIFTLCLYPRESGKFLKENRYFQEMNRYRDSFRYLQIDACRRY